MSQYEKLKAICNKIGYKLEERVDENMRNSCWELIDIREIIFTQDFMDKYYIRPDVRSLDVRKQDR